MNRTQRAEKAQETLDIFKAGRYAIGGNTADGSTAGGNTAGGGAIECKSCFTTELFKEKQLKEIVLPDRDLSPKYEVLNESVVDTVLRNESCGVLNFASAKNPGGGFLNGAVAQEECLAVSSDLYISQLQAPGFYDDNRQQRSALYTHNMIYSGNITFIRDGKLDLIKSPVKADVLTSPAVNAGAYYRNENGSRATVLKTMETRIRYILALFASKGVGTIVLGAYGCGVFGNEASDVAGTFSKLLRQEKYERHFSRIIFAVYDTNGQQFRVFQRTFN